MWKHWRISSYTRLPRFSVFLVMMRYNMRDLLTVMLETCKQGKRLDEDQHHQILLASVRSDLLM